MENNKNEKKLIQKPLTKIENDNFILLSHITPINSKVILTKEEAMLLYIELHKFIMDEK